MNFKNPIESKKEEDSRGVFFENKDMDSLAAKFLDMQRYSIYFAHFTTMSAYLRGITQDSPYTRYFQVS